jgi:HEAT repeat protein
MKKFFAFAVTAFFAGLIPLHAGVETNDSADHSQSQKIVEEMRGFSMQPAGVPRSDGKVDPREQRRQEIIRQLRNIGRPAVPALASALKDPDPQMRRNAELVIISLAGAYDGGPEINIQEALPALVTATEDADSTVRAWAAHALAEMGPEAKDAVPALLKLLNDPDEGPRNTSCMALGAIGPAAKEALPALRNALNDSSKDVRQFAKHAIEKIEDK